MKTFTDIPISVLDLAPIREGGTAADAFRNSLDLARHAERWGYKRYWLAEHHNIPGIASAATAVVIGYIAGGTSRIRVGAGGIMLPNHAPLVIAEQFGTLDSLYPGRIDLGLGRAPGGDQRTAQALRRKLGSGADTFPQDLLELQAYFRPATPGQAVRAIPGEGLDVPSGCWVRATSAPASPPSSACRSRSPRTSRPTTCSRPSTCTATLQALRIARPSRMPWSASTSSRPTPTRRPAACSPRCSRPSSTCVRGRPGPLSPPVDDMDGRWTPAERPTSSAMTRVSVVGSPETVRKGLKTLIAATDADELMLTGQIFDHPRGCARSRFLLICIAGSEA